MVLCVLTRVDADVVQLPSRTRPDTTTWTFNGGNERQATEVRTFVCYITFSFRPHSVHS